MKSNIPADWQPANPTLQLLVQNNISREFSLALVAEFRLFWSEHGLRHHAWNSKFLKHVMHEWRRHEIEIAKGNSMHAMHAKWWPQQRALDILQRDGITAEFAVLQLPEFRLYWSDRGEVTNTWNTKFIAHARYKWQNRALGTAAALPSHKSSLADDLSNRSWASGYLGVDHDSGK